MVASCFPSLSNLEVVDEIGCTGNEGGEVVEVVGEVRKRSMSFDGKWKID